MNKVNWLEMLPHEFHQMMEKTPVGYMAYGLAEPHGVYNALGLDYMVAHGLVTDAAKKFGGIVAPPFAWHIQEQQYYDWEMDCCGMGMSISSSIPEELYLHNMVYHIRNFDSKGFKAVILLSGHFINKQANDMQRLADLYMRRTGTPMRITASTYDFFNTSGIESDGHAGTEETSLFMNYRPELVDLTMIGKPLAVPESVAGGGLDEYGPYCAPKNFGKDGKLPSADIGKQIAGNICDNLGLEAEKLLAAYVSKPGYKAPSLIDTEDIYNRYMKLAARYLSITATRAESETWIFPEFPGWEAMGE